MEIVAAWIGGAVIGLFVGWYRKPPVAKVRIEVPRNGTFVMRPGGETHLVWEWEPKKPDVSS